MVYMKVTLTKLFLKIIFYLSAKFKSENRSANCLYYKRGYIKNVNFYYLLAITLRFAVL